MCVFSFFHGFSRVYNIVCLVLLFGCFFPYYPRPFRDLFFYFV